MDLSFEQIRNLLYEAIQPPTRSSSSPSCWIESVYEDDFVYNKAGKLFRAPYEIDDDSKVKLGDPVEVKVQTKYVAVFGTERLFSAFKEASADGKTVIRRGKVFEAGDYPDKDVSFDESDLDRAVTAFAPVDNDLEHASTILDGHLGKLQKVWRKGAELHGEVHLPAWLDEAIGDEQIKVSLAFDRAKNIVGNGLVLRPRIADAAIMSAFSSSISSPLSKGLKPEENKPMKLKDAIKHLFGLDTVEDLDAEVTLPEGTPPAPSPATPPVEAPAPVGETETPPVFNADPRLRALEAEIVKTKALAFADEMIRSKKAVPTQRHQIAAMFTGAVRQDAAGGTVFTAENGVVEGKSVEGLRAYFAAAPAHAFAGEAFVDDVAVLLFGNKRGEAMEADKKANLLSLSALGRKAQEASGKN